jgi:lysyl-tRNA synthetase, class II
LTTPLASAFDAIQNTGREPELIFLLAFLGTFAFIRTSAHMINAGVSWWPGNVEVGGTHIHHLVWGILVVVITGYLMGVAGIRDQPAYYIIVGLFGFGCGLTFDEFALWLNLRDVYWEKEGRRSIDAVIVVALLSLIGITGFGAWVESADNITNGAFAAVGVAGAIALGLALVTAAKGRLLLAAFAVLLWPVGVIGATRLAKPGSLWARWFGTGTKRRPGT